MSIHRFLSACCAVFLMISQAQAFLTLPDRLIKPAFSLDSQIQQQAQRQQGFGFGGAQISPSSVPRGTLFYVPTTDGKTAIFVKDKINGRLSVFGADTFKFVEEKGWDMWAKNNQGAFEFNEIEVIYGADAYKKVKIQSTVPGYTGEFPVITSLIK